MNPQHAHILVVDDEKNLCRILAKILKGAGYEVTCAHNATDALQILGQETIDGVLSDIRMPEMDGIELLERIKKKDKEIAVIMMTAYPSIDGVVRAMKAGAYDYIQKPFENNEEILLTIERAIERRTLLERNRLLSEQMEARYGLENIIGKSPAMQRIYDMITRVAPTQSTVLILGESGTGKEMVARAIHQVSDRRKYSFVAINCGALPRDLLESELFGYEKGAFTDAKTSKKGLVEVAAGGTLFLDEIGDLPLELQTKILRTIETREYRRLGSTQWKQVDIRILAATNRDLEQAIKAERFREDLYYRLNTLQIVLPPLRDRREDIPILVEHFIAELNKTLKKRTSGVSSRAMRGLMRYDWPGNVRELQKSIERAMILQDNPVLEFEDFGLPLELAGGQSRQSAPDQWDESTVLSYRKAKEIFERQYFEDLLRLNDDNVTRSALAAGMSRRHLQEKIRQLNINRPGGDEGEEEGEESL